MATTIADTLKSLGAAVLQRIGVPVGVVDDDPPTYADGDVKPFLINKTNRGVIVHVENAADIGGGGGGGEVTQGMGSGTEAGFWTVRVSDGAAFIPFPTALGAGGGLKIDGSGTALPVSGPLTDTQLRATAVPVSGPLTDVQLRATAVPVSGPITDTQLRASPVPVSAASLPLPTGAANATNQSALIDRIDPVWIAASTNLVGSKAARVLTLFGRRTVSTFINATQYHDLVSYATVDAAVVDMTGSEALEIVSSSANDTAAGTAARTVKIWYIDALAGDVEATTTVTLNGTTPVALGAGIRAKNIQWMEVRTAGSANHNEGTITLRTAGAGTTWEQIPALQRRSFSARYMVPAGAVAYIKSPRFTAIAQRMDFALLANESEDGTNLGNVYIPHHPSTLPANASSPVLEAPDHKFSAGTRIKFAAIAAATASNPTASAEFTVLQIAL